MAQELAGGGTTVIGNETRRRGPGRRAGQLDREKKRKCQRTKNEGVKKKKGVKSRKSGNVKGQSTKWIKMQLGVKRGIK